MMEQNLSIGSDIGQIDKTIKVKPVETKPSRYPIYGVKDLKAGQKFGGKYIGTRRWTNNDGWNESEKIVHEFIDTKGQKFGLWATGVTENFFEKCPLNAYVIVTYLGKANQPYKPGQSPAHEFNFEVDESVNIVN